MANSTTKSKKSNVKKSNVKKATTKIGSIIIDAMNEQLIIYPRDNFGGAENARHKKVKGDKALVKRGVNMGFNNKVIVYDRFTNTTLNFKRLLEGL